MLQQHWIVYCANSMTDAFRSKLECAPHRLGTAGFSRVRCETQPFVARKPINIGEPLGGTARFISTNSKRYNAIAHALSRKLRHLHDMLDAEVPNGIDVPLHFDR